MRIAITGSAGMLGSALKQVLDDRETVFLTRSDFDITDLNLTTSRIKELKPDYMIHAAAFTNVDECENDPDKAYMVNGIGARNVVMACDSINCPVMYISTDYVFDGEKRTPYNEWDHPNPINKYGLSKLIGEYFVSMLTNRFYIVRTSWMYGKNGKNFVDSIIKLISEKKEIDVVDDQVGSPTYAYDLAVKIKELIGRGYGVYHMTNSSFCTWYEFANEIAKQKGIDTKTTPVSSKGFKSSALRPAFSVLGSTMLRLEGIADMRPWQEAIKEYLSLS